MKAIDFINFVCDIYEVDKSKRLSKIKELAKMLELDKNLNDKISTSVKEASNSDSKLYDLYRKQNLSILKFLQKRRFF